MSPDTINKLLKHGVFTALLLPLLLVAVAGPAAGIGFFFDKKQDPLAFDPHNVTSGSCVPTDAQKYLPFFNAAATWASGLYTNTNPGAKIDPNLLIAMAQQESHFNPNALSSADAKGLMQLLPETFSSNRNKDKANNILDPEANIYAGAAYIALGLRWAVNSSDNSPIFSTSPYHKHALDLTIAGYNGGYGTDGQGAVKALSSFPESINHAKYVEGYYKAILDCQGKASSSAGVTPGSLTELKQADSQWQTYPNFIGLACGATSTAMGLNALGYAADPLSARLLEDKVGASAPGSGIINISAIGKIASNYPGLTMTYTEDPIKAEQAAQEGHPVLFGYVAGSPIFPTVSASGHWVLIYGYDSSTKQYTVHNPGRAEGAYQKQVSTADILTTPNSRSFWIMSK